MSNARISLTTYPQVTDITVRRLPPIERHATGLSVPEVFVVDMYLKDRALFSLELDTKTACALMYDLALRMKERE